MHSIKHSSIFRVCKDVIHGEVLSVSFLDLREVPKTKLACDPLSCEQVYLGMDLSIKMSQFLSLLASISQNLANIHSESSGTIQFLSFVA